MNTKTLFAGTLMMFSVSLFAQKNQLQNTSNALKFKELDKAKAAIDLAAEHADTKDTPKMWYLRGKTYILIAEDKEKFKNLDPDATEKAAVSFLNCLKTDKENIYTEEVRGYAVSSAVQLYFKGVDALNANEYDKAIRYFNFIYEVFPYDKDGGLKRSNITKESLNLDLFDVNQRKGDNAKAKEYLQKLIDVRYNNADIFLYMASILLDEKDTLKALSYIEQGRERFDENPKLIDWQMKLYLMQKNEDKLLEKINKAIESTSDNPVLYYIRGLIYQGKGQNDKAEADLKKSLELNPESVDANYQMGKLYYDRGGEWIKKADDLKPSELNTKGKEYDAKSQEEFKKAVSYFEKAHEINPKDEDVNKALLSSYRLVGDTEKYNKLKATVTAPK